MDGAAAAAAVEACGRRGRFRARNSNKIHGNKIQIVEGTKKTEFLKPLSKKGAKWELILFFQKPRLLSPRIPSCDPTFTGEQSKAPKASSFFVTLPHLDRHTFLFSDIALSLSVSHLEQELLKLRTYHGKI
jgi:hypothetical protein